MIVKMLMVTTLCIAGVPLFAQCCGGKTAAVQPPKTEKTSKTAKAAKPQTVKLPALIELGAKQCVPCKKMAPIIADMTKEYKGILTVKFIDVWKKENVAQAQKYKIDSIPTQIFLDKNGKELWRHTGYISKKDILEKWKKLGYDMEKLKKDQKK